MFRKLTLNIKNRELDLECQIKGFWIPGVILLFVGRHPYANPASSEIFEQRGWTLYGRKDKVCGGRIRCIPLFKFIEGTSLKNQLAFRRRFPCQAWIDIQLGQMIFCYVRIWCPPWIISQDQLDQHLERVWPYCDVKAK